MRLTSDKEEMIFRKDINDKTFYNVALSNKLQDGTWEKGYITVQFKKGVELKNQTKILIKEAYLKFYKKDKQTIPYILICDFELPNNLEAMKQVAPNEVQFDDGDYPF